MPTSPTVLPVRGLTCYKNLECLKCTLTRRCVAAADIVAVTMRGGKELIDLKFSLTLQKSTVIMSRVYETVDFERTKDFIFASDVIHLDVFVL
jgi:hypothetical protein